MKCWQPSMVWPMRSNKKRWNLTISSNRGAPHLQDADTVRLGQEFGGYACAVERDAERIRRSAEGLRRLGIGGTATGTGLNAHTEYHARMVEKLSEISGIPLYRVG